MKYKWKTTNKNLILFRSVNITNLSAFPFPCASWTYSPEALGLRHSMNVFPVVDPTGSTTRNHRVDRIFKFYPRGRAHPRQGRFLSPNVLPSGQLFRVVQKCRT